MGIVAYYARLTLDQIDLIRKKPDRIFNLTAEPGFHGAELIDVDKNWEILSWFVSPRKRIEHKLVRANYAALDRCGISGSMEEFRAVEDEEQAKLGVARGDDEKSPLDLPLVAIEGRVREDQRDKAITFGYGGACIFSPPDVLQSSESLISINSADIKAIFDREKMAHLDVGGISWLEESDSVVDEIIIPLFSKIRDFYQRAAHASQYVIVVYA